MINKIGADCNGSDFISTEEFQKLLELDRCTGRH